MPEPQGQSGAASALGLAYNLGNFLRRLELPRALFVLILDRIQRFGVQPPLVQRS